MQRTMLELLNQLDGFSSDERIKVSFVPFLNYFDVSHSLSHLSVGCVYVDFVCV